jgi:hypothetical protein
MNKRVIKTGGALVGGRITGGILFCIGIRGLNLLKIFNRNW